MPDAVRPWLNKLGELEPHRQDGARIHDHCKSRDICEKAVCYMPDAQMTGSASDFHKFHVTIAQKGTAANGYQVSSHSTATLIAVVL